MYQIQQDKLSYFCLLYTSNGVEVDAVHEFTISLTPASEVTIGAVSYTHLTKPYIQQYIEEKQKELESNRMADMTEVREFWTEAMRNPDNAMKDRLKASEMIARTSGAFLEKVEVNANVTNTNPYRNLSEDELKRLAGIE